MNTKLGVAVLAALVTPPAPVETRATSAKTGAGRVASPRDGVFTRPGGKRRARPAP